MVSGWLLNLTRVGAVGAGIMAGFFFAYSNGVMPALKKLPADQGAAAMQNINRDVQNPLFLVIFIGSTLAAAALAISSTWTWDEGSAGLRLAGGGLFVVGNFGSPSRTTYRATTVSTSRRRSGRRTSTSGSPGTTCEPSRARRHA